MIREFKMLAESLTRTNVKVSISLIKIYQDARTQFAICNPYLEYNR